MSDGVGAAYRVPVSDNAGRIIHLVVKFNRFAENTELYNVSEYPAGISPGIIGQTPISTVRLKNSDFSWNFGTVVRPDIQ